MIQSGEIDEARNLLQTTYKSLYETNTKIRAYLDVLNFINMIGDRDLPAALDFSLSHLR